MSDPLQARKPSALEQWSDLLVCPECRSALRFSDAEAVCSGCARTYPVEQGIPVLIPGRATSPARP